MSERWIEGGNKDDYEDNSESTKQLAAGEAFAHFQNALGIADFFVRKGFEEDGGDLVHVLKAGMKAMLHALPYTNEQMAVFAMKAHDRNPGEVPELNR